MGQLCVNCIRIEGSQPVGPCLFRRQDAFTFLEIIFVIALIAVIYTFAAPQIGLRTGTEVTVKMGALAADIRNAYDLAVLSRKPYRLVFHLASGDYHLQTTDRDDFRLGDVKSDHDLSQEDERLLLEVFDEEFKDYEELAGEEVKDYETDDVIPAVSAVLKGKDKLRPVEWQDVATKKWKGKSLGPVLLIRDFQAEHHGNKQTLEELEEEGRAMLYFFPSGYVEKAVIHVAFRDEGIQIDEDQIPFTVTTNPREGTAEVESGYKEYEVHGDYKFANSE